MVHGNSIEQVTHIIVIAVTQALLVGIITKTVVH